MKSKQYKAIGNWIAMSIGYASLRADPVTRIVSGLDKYPELIEQLLNDNMIEVYIEPKPINLKPVSADLDLEDQTGVK